MEFLGLPEKGVKDESEPEDAIISHLAEFLLELGKGYTFVARQKSCLGIDSLFSMEETSTLVRDGNRVLPHK